MKQDITFAKLSAAFLEWSRANNKPRTFEEHSHTARSFGEFIGNAKPVARIIPYGRARRGSLTPLHVRPKVSRLPQACDLCGVASRLPKTPLAIAVGMLHEHALKAGGGVF